jgi:hypothetical protein
MFLCTITADSHHPIIIQKIFSVNTISLELFKKIDYVYSF